MTDDTMRRALELPLVVSDVNSGHILDAEGDLVATCEFEGHAAEIIRLTNSTPDPRASAGEGEVADLVRRLKAIADYYEDAWGKRPKQGFGEPSFVTIRRAASALDAPRVARYEDLLRRLDYRACGEHPDSKIRQDTFAREAADAIRVLLASPTRPPAPAAVEITDAMVEAAAKALARHRFKSWWPTPEAIANADRANPADGNILRAFVSTNETEVARQATMLREDMRVALAAAIRERAP